MPRFLKAVNSDPAFALGAAANPILAMEESGLRFAPEFRPVLDRHIRFRGETRDELNRLAAEVQEAAGCAFDLDSAGELERVLFSQLELERPRPRRRTRSKASGPQQAAPAGEAAGAARAVTERLRPTVFGESREEDPLESLRDAHPVMKPLLEYRRLERTEPRLAPDALYSSLRNQGLSGSFRVSKLRAIHKHEEAPE